MDEQVPRPPIRHLYLHTPFCAKICPYCAFYVHGGSAGKQRKFAEAMAADLKHAATCYDFSQLETVYFGGGTPSMLNAELFQQIADALPSPKARRDMEVTIEVNPATVTNAKAIAWKNAGINRISLGAQSFDADFLKMLGRQHEPEDVPETVGQLREEGFSNISIDLMFALPSQPEATWKSTVETALACQPEHLSAYALTYEEDTPFFEKLQKGEWHLGPKEEEREARMFTWTADRLAEAGLPAYEVSNFARPGFESRHNQAYWQGHDYLGIGPSAWSTVGEQRWQVVRDTQRYIDLIQAEDWPALRTEHEHLDATTRRRERIMFGLRTRKGASWEDIEALGSEAEAAALQSIQDGLTSRQKKSLILTLRGRLVADGVAALFV